MRVAMIGTGYVGLVSGACFADFGHVVTCIDKDAGKIARLEAGEIPIFEPGLDDLVARNVREGRLLFATESAKAVEQSIEKIRRRVDALARELNLRTNDRRPSTTRLRALDAGEPPEAHIERVRRAQELISAGDLYQVNLARRLRFEVLGSPFDIYTALAARAPAPFGAGSAVGAAGRRFE